MSEQLDAGSTLDLMDFENVRDGGVVETPTTYAMLIRVHPRDWLILSEERQESVYVAFMTYLRGLQFPTQILSMTTTYDPEPYLERFRLSDDPVIGPSGGADTDGDALDESPLLDYGRQFHAEWLRNTIETGEIRDREFYVAVSVPKEDENSGGFLSSVRSSLPGGSSNDDVDEDDYLEEVWSRAQRVASKLPQTRVTTDILDSRPAVLEVLYEHYHGEKAPISFTQGTFTTANRDLQQNPSVDDSAQNVDAEAEDTAVDDGVDVRDDDHVAEDSDSQPGAFEVPPEPERDESAEETPPAQKAASRYDDVPDVEDAVAEEPIEDSETGSNSSRNPERSPASEPEPSPDAAVEPAPESEAETDPEPEPSSEAHSASLASDNDRLLAYLAGEDDEDDDDQSARSDPFSLVSSKDDESRAGRL